MILDSDLKTIFLVYYDNNPLKFNEAFRLAGYSVPADATAAKKFCVLKMYELYFSNPAKLNSIMNSVPWDTQNPNYTNKGDTRGKITQYLSANVKGLGGATGRFGDGIKDWLFGNQSTVVSQTQTTTTPIPSSASSAGLIALSVLGAGVVVMVIFLMRS